MYTITGRNVNHTYPQGVALLWKDGVRRASRNGDTLEVPAPVTTVTLNPLERVLWDPTRDANTAFHLLEALWILAGRNDARTLSVFNARMASFADPDTGRYHAAYGQRLRVHWGDQLHQLILRLQANPDDRQLVASIWDPTMDLFPTPGPDIPCNDLLVFRVATDGRLDLHVTCRSNDAVWGTYGTNPVQFGTLLEYVAARARVPVGVLRQTSISYHGYLATLPTTPPPVDDVYVRWGNSRTPDPIVTHPLVFDQDNAAFWNGLEARLAPGAADVWPRPTRYHNPIFPTVAWPLARAFLRRRMDTRPWATVREQFQEDAGEALGTSDWLWASDRWMDRR